MLDKDKLLSIFRKNMPILYKLSVDCLLILALFFILVLIAEGLLPGIVSARLELYKIGILTYIIALFSLALRNACQPDTKQIFDHRILWVMLTIIIILIFNALFALPIMLNLFILSLIGVTIFYIFKAFQEE